jgi:DNA-binding NtrC family response regulator
MSKYDSDQHLEERSVKLVRVNGKTYLLTPDQWSAAKDQTDLDRLMEEVQSDLIKTYLVFNMYHKKISLREFMADLEHKTLELAMQMAMGSQKNTAELLDLKPSTLGEKLRRMGHPPEKQD